MLEHELQRDDGCRERMSREEPENAEAEQRTRRSLPNRQPASDPSATYGEYRSWRIEQTVRNGEVVVIEGQRIERWQQGPVDVRDQHAAFGEQAFARREITEVGDALEHPCGDPCEAQQQWQQKDHAEGPKYRTAHLPVGIAKAHDREFRACNIERKQDRRFLRGVPELPCKGSD